MTTLPTHTQQLHISGLDDLPFPPAMQHRIDQIASLGRRRDAILNAPEFDLEAAKQLLADYEQAKMPSCAESMRRRIEHYQQELEANHV
jgi:hypothetical protein